MTWSYSGDPSNSDVDRCRFMIGDTDESNQLMQDEEIQYIIADSANDDALFYALFKRAATLYARDIKRSLGPQSEDPTSRLDFFAQEARKYEVKLRSGGLSLPSYAHEKIFTIGMHSNPPVTNDEASDV